MVVVVSDAAAVMSLLVGVWVLLLLLLIRLSGQQLCLYKCPEPTSVLNLSRLLVVVVVVVAAAVMSLLLFFFLQVVVGVVGVCVYVAVVVADTLVRPAAMFVQVSRSSANPDHFILCVLVPLAADVVSALPRSLFHSLLVC